MTIMKTKYIPKTLFTLLLAFFIASCGYNEDVLEELAIDREFAPVDLTARVRNQTSVELNWMVNDITTENISYYIVEFSADDSNFGTIFLTEQVSADELPIQIRLEGETLYSIRVKAVSSRGLKDSSWAIVEAQTLTEQIMLPSELGDIEASQATLRWEAGLNVTHFILQPGDIRYDINNQEKAVGVATIPNLISETDYAATLYNSSKIRGTVEFTTGIDVGGNTLVLPTDDLLQMIADAAPGDILLLEQGDYTSQTGTVILDKPITIQGLRVDFKPQVSLAFELTSGATDVNLIDLDIDGALTYSDAVDFSGTGNYNSLLISGCYIHDFTRSLIKGHTTDALIQTVTIENCIVTDIVSSGGDFIDFRNSNVYNLNLTTSTFDNCAPGRDFIRIDDAGSTSGGIGYTSNVLIDECTLYKVANSSSKRIVYVRFNVNEIEIRNTLITDSPDIDAISDRTQTDENIVFVNNNYFNAPALTDSSEVRYDPNATTLNPGFVDAENGDFTVTNQTILDNQIGDPRWRL